MAHPSNVYRRPSGIYVVRLVVPARHRKAVGKGEIHLSTASRIIEVAKATACRLLAHWREVFLGLDRHDSMDLKQLWAGSPLLTGDGHVTLRMAADLAGLEVADLLRVAAEGAIGLSCRLGEGWGHLAHADTVTDDLAAFGADGAPAGPLLSDYRTGAGLWTVWNQRSAASQMLAGEACFARVFGQIGSGNFVFVTDTAVTLTEDCLEVAGAEVEALRLKLRATMTREQVKAAIASIAAPAKVAPRPSRKLTEAIDAYMQDKAKSCAPDHARRTRSACELLKASEGNLALEGIDRTLLRRFVSITLPNEPARASVARAKYPDGIPADWPRMSQGQQLFRVTCLGDMFRWLVREGWIDDDPSAGLARLARTDCRAARRRSQDARDFFTVDELKLIFGAQWWTDGRGTMTKANTYREFMPLYFWLPLLGLYTGARINELCQLGLDDLKQTASGVWFIDVNENDEDRKLKNTNSRRLIPVHPRLVELGLIDWRNRLKVDGFDRLFPELRHDRIKGFSKAAVKWFSGHLERLGWVRDGRRTFHSFRHGFINKCVNELELPASTVSQLTGHERGQSTLMNTYRKDIVPDELVSAVSALRFDLPPISIFDCDAGMKAVRDALARKHGTKRRIKQAS